MELGELEFAVLHAVRTLREATSGEIFRAVKKERNVAYTSVTTTLYRLVEKGLIAVRKQSEKRVYYRLNEGRAYRRALAAIVDQLVSAFGAPAVSYLLQGDNVSSESDPDGLRTEIAKRRGKEETNG